MKFIKEKFDAIVIVILFVVVTAIWIALDFADQLRDFVTGLFGAVLIVLGIRPRPGHSAGIENAKTEHGDIIAERTNYKENKEDEV